MAEKHEKGCECCADLPPYFRAINNEDEFRIDGDIITGIGQNEEGQIFLITEHGLYQAELELIGTDTALQ